MPSLAFENLVKDLFIKSLYSWMTVMGMMAIFTVLAIWIAQFMYPFQMYLPEWIYPIFRWTAFGMAAAMLLAVFGMHSRVTRRAYLERLRRTPSDWDQLAPSLKEGEPQALAVVQDTLAQGVTIWGLTGWIALVGVALFLMSGLVLDLTVYMGLAGTALVLVRPSMPRINSILASYQALEEGQMSPGATYSPPRLGPTDRSAMNG